MLVSGAANLFQKAVKVGCPLGATGPELHALVEHRVAGVVHTWCPQALGTLIRLQPDTSTLSVNLYIMLEAVMRTTLALVIQPEKCVCLSTPEPHEKILLKTANTC